MDSESCFRGRNPPASLKHLRPLPVPAVVLLGFPGEKSSGLIEAFLLAVQSVSMGAVFPGEKSSGLIEAMPFAITARWPARGFRGRNPPASLKRRRRPRRRRPPRFRGRNPPASLKRRSERCSLPKPVLFPGEKSSGLIEAHVGSPLPAPCLTFPGEKSSGLIEAAAPRPSRPWDHRCFRGRNPPASLKRVAGMGAEGRGGKFPGEKSSGLIEAPQPRWPRTALRRRVSGGEILRPH